MSTENSAPSKATMVKVGVVAGAALILAVLAPLIMLAVKAGLALLALGIVVVAGGILYKALPLIGQKSENWILGKRKQEARQNPIEQLENLLMAKAQAVDIVRHATTKISAQIKGMEEMVKSRKKAKPNADVSEQESAIVAMKGAHKQLTDMYERAEKALDNLREIIEDKKWKWNFAKMGQEALSNLNAAGGKNLLDQVLADEAFSSVRDEFNTVFAELEVESKRIANSREIRYGGQAIDVTDLRLPGLQT